MPNLDPQEWTDSAPKAAPGPWGGPCHLNGCVAVEVIDDEVVCTSTIEGNEGRVVYTRDEWNAFVAQVKEGAWDHTVTGVPASA